jgi:hypothetical protein
MYKSLFGSRFLNVLGLLFMIVGGFSVSVSAQEATVVSGGYAAGLYGSASYSLGQNAYYTFSSLSGTVTQGVQQPFEVFALSDGSIPLSVNFTLYPNPTYDRLYVDIADNVPESLVLSVFDMKGGVIHTQRVIDSITMISLDGLSSGIYVVKIMESSERSQSFKIVKY